MPLAKSDQEPELRLRGEMKAKPKYEDGDMWVGPREFGSQRGRKGLKKTVQKGPSNWSYMSSAPVGNSKKRAGYKGARLRHDEMFANEAWLKDGIKDDKKKEE